VFRSNETDASTWPPDFKNATQAVLNAHDRGFEVIPLNSNGTPADPDWRCRTMSAADIRERWTRGLRCKVGAIADDLIVVALYLDDPEYADKLRALQAERTAAILSRLQRRVLFFFQPSPGARGSVERTLPFGVDVLTEEYVPLPSGSPTDGCRWLNRYAIAPAPSWLLNQLVGFADATFFTNTFLPLAHVVSATAEGGVQ
jgi:Bifunctional DNA primase/polymerase, N-terminal